MHGRDDKYTQNSGKKNLKGRDHLEDPSIDGRITLEW
jgi:hypothetical protein